MYILHLAYRQACGGGSVCCATKATYIYIYIPRFFMLYDASAHFRSKTCGVYTYIGIKIDAGTTTTTTNK